jgi:sulfotransferase family protein
VNVSQNGNDKVLFIGGLGRSGSTLLDMLLGQIGGFCSTGELRFIWERGFGENQLCGCGKPFKDCDFWSKVVEEAFGGFQNVNHERLAALRASAERRLYKSALLNTVADIQASHKDYFDAARKLYRAIRNVSGCEVIVDSSKYVGYGFLLASIPDIDLFTVHLVRDSRAVAYSWRRKKVRPEIQGEQRYMGQRGILQSAGRWSVRNILAHRLQRTSKQYAFLRYEDLVINPQASLSKLLTDLELQTTSLDFLDGFRASLKTSHTVSGNPMRFERKEIKIQADTQWQNDMVKSHRWLVTLVTWPLLLKYGYFGDRRLIGKGAS